MPGGASLLGVAYFSAVKLAGYSYAGHFINTREQLAAPRPLMFGAGRTALGIAVGVPTSFGMAMLFPDHPMSWFLLALVPIRLLEWLLMLWLAYRAPSGPWTRRWRYAGYGIAWSFVLDVPAIAAMFVLPGGFWIC